MLLQNAEHIAVHFWIAEVSHVVGANEQHDSLEDVEMHAVNLIYKKLLILLIIIFYNKNYIFMEYVVLFTTGSIVI